MKTNEMIQKRDFTLRWMNDSYDPEGIVELCPGRYHLESIIQVGIAGPVWALVRFEKSNDVLKIRLRDFYRFIHWESSQF